MNIRISATMNAEKKLKVVGYNDECHFCGKSYEVRMLKLGNNTITYCCAQCYPLWAKVGGYLELVAIALYLCGLFMVGVTVLSGALWLVQRYGWTMVPVLLVSPFVGLWLLSFPFMWWEKRKRKT
jgi:hypothetical protein